MVCVCVQRVRRWTALKDTLGNLETFELMYSGELRKELLNYWKQLTLGPLFITDQLATQVSHPFPHKHRRFQTPAPPL